MIVNNSSPSISRPCIVQINYDNGNIGFYRAKEMIDAEKSYLGKIVAVFEPTYLGKIVAVFKPKNKINT